MSAASKARVWGLTGGVASGKSTVAKIFAEMGIPVLDADQVSRELSSPGGGAHAEIVGRFGTADRAQLRDIVFADEKARKDLQAILHPKIAAESAARFAKHGEAKNVIYEAALLVETGRYKEFAGLIVVEAPRELRIERLMTRDRISRELAERILATQLSDEERRRVATAVLVNTGSLEELRAQVAQFCHQYF